jgi:hypothetical protein
MSGKTIVIRSPSPDSAELVIGNGDHTCKVYPLTFEQVRLLSHQACRAVAFWPAEPQQLPGGD